MSLSAGIWKEIHHNPGMGEDIRAGKYDEDIGELHAMCERHASQHMQDIRARMRELEVAPEDRPERASGPTEPKPFAGFGGDKGKGGPKKVET